MPEPEPDAGAVPAPVVEVPAAIEPEAPAAAAVVAEPSPAPEPEREPEIAPAPAAAVEEPPAPRRTAIRSSGTQSARPPLLPARPPPHRAAARCGGGPLPEDDRPARPAPSPPCLRRRMPPSQLTPTGDEIPPAPGGGSAGGPRRRCRRRPASRSRRHPEWVAAGRCSNAVVRVSDGRAGRACVRSVVNALPARPVVAAVASAARAPVAAAVAASVNVPVAARAALVAARRRPRWRPRRRPCGGRGGPQRRTPRPRKGGRRRRNREELQPFETPTYTHSSAPVPEGVVVIERSTTPQDLGPKLNRTAADVVRFLMQQGEMVTATQSLTDDMIELFAAEVGAELRLVNPGEEQEVELQKLLDLPAEEEEDEGDLEPRPPVITVMGHVDHGKTKLLDQIRNANVVAGEAGGITQHIGAYQTEKNGRLITFIDTPGHEAFTAMRARGAEATDIVVLVVAADDGVMPQTIEALNHAKAADVPIVVAINKIDREQANPDRVMQQLSEHGLVPTQWNGDTEMVQISALQNLGIDDLLDTLLITADLEELTANPDARAQGVVLEAHLDVGRGPVATVLVQRGTLKVGDPMVAGPAWGRVRA